MAETPLSKPSQRSVAKARREQKAELRRLSFEAFASGFPPATVARLRGVSVKTIRREIDRAIDERRLDAPERYVHIQVARLTKALRLADALVTRGEVKGVAPLIKAVVALDRYHGLKPRARPTCSEARTIAAAPAVRALPAAAPKLTHAARALDRLSTLLATAKGHKTAGPSQS